MWYYIYVLKSEKDGLLYTGYTDNLKRRIEDHNKGNVSSTRKRLPVTLIYSEACLNQQDATKREAYLKTTYGKRYLKNRLRNYFTG